MRSVLVMVMGAVTALAGGKGVLIAKNHPFQAEVAVTDQERARGLMGRASLAPNACMIFLYEEEGHYRIWMKNCLISLDVAWLDKDGRVVELVPEVPPPSPMRMYPSDADYPNYGGSVPSRTFVEFPVGTFKRIGLKKGDHLSWELKLEDGTTRKNPPAGKAKK